MKKYILKVLKWLITIFNSDDYCSHCGYYCNGESIYCTKDQTI